MNRHHLAPPSMRVVLVVSLLLAFVWIEQRAALPAARAVTPVSISAGVYHTCGLKGDGTVACWGRNDAGQATPPAGTLTAPVRSSALKLGTMWKYIYPVFQSARAPLNDHIAQYRA